MTEEQAIEYVENHGYISDEVKDIVIKALKKQIPIKLTKSYDDDAKEHWCSCGVCAKGFGWEFAVGNKYNYCLDCGKKIDRSDAENDKCR